VFLDVMVYFVSGEGLFAFPAKLHSKFQANQAEISDRYDCIS